MSLLPVFQTVKIKIWLPTQQENDAVAAVVHLHRPQGLEAVLLGHTVDQGLVQRAPVQGRGLRHVPAQDLPNGPVKGRRGLVFIL